MPMARFEAHVAGRELEVFSRLGGGPRGGGGDPLALDGVSCALCHQLQNAGPGLEHDGEFKIDTARPWGERLVFGPYDIPPAARARHALGDGVPPRARDQSGTVRALLHLPHAVHDAARWRRPGRRRRQTSAALPRAGAVPGMAGQRLRPREELPGLPHDVHRRARAGGQRARRAARAVRAPRISGRELLHAGDAGTVPRRAGRRGAAPGAEPVAAADAGASAHERRHACRSRAPRSATGVSRPRSSSPTRRATSCRPRTRRAAPGSAFVVSDARRAAAVLVGRAAPRRQHRGERQRPRPARVRAAPSGHRNAPTRCRSTNRSWWTRAGA